LYQAGQKLQEKNNNFDTFFELPFSTPIGQRWSQLLDRRFPLALSSRTAPLRCAALMTKRWIDIARLRTIQWAAKREAAEVFEAKDGV
jgi:hypothetical protein